jgi:hypothetical protein
MARVRGEVVRRTEGVSEPATEVPLRCAWVEGGRSLLLPLFGLRAEVGGVEGREGLGAGSSGIAPRSQASLLHGSGSGSWIQLLWLTAMSDRAWASLLT